MHKDVSSIRSLLEENNISYKFLKHAPGKTSEEMVAIRKDFSLSEGAKALILQTDSGFVQAVIPGDKRISSKKLRNLLKSKIVRFAKPEELEMVTAGILPGAVHPFGTLFNILVYADEGIFKNKEIVFNCGERTVSIAMNPDDYRIVVNPIISDITE